MVSTASAARWKALGALLIQRRTALNPRWHNRGAFAEATGLSYRLVYDVEEARRTNFGNSTLAAIEAAYDLAPGSISRALEGGELSPPSTEIPRPLAAVPDLPDESPSSDADAMETAVIVAATPRMERLIWARLRRNLAATAEGAKLFSGADQARAWPDDSAPIELTAEAIKVLDAIIEAGHADLLASHPIDNAAVRLEAYSWPDRIGVAAAGRGRVGRPTRAARRAG